MLLIIQSIQLLIYPFYFSLITDKIKTKIPNYLQPSTVLHSSLLSRAKLSRDKPALYERGLTNKD